MKIYFIFLLYLILPSINCSITNCEKSQVNIVYDTYCYKKCSKKVLGVCTEHDTVCERQERKEEVCTQCLYGYVLIDGKSCIIGIDYCASHEANANPAKCLNVKRIILYLIINVYTLYRKLLGIFRKFLSM